MGRREKRRVEHCQSRTFSQNSVMADKNREGWSVRSGGADVPRSGSYSGRVYREEEKKRKEVEMADEKDEPTRMLMKTATMTQRVRERERGRERGRGR